MKTAISVPDDTYERVSRRAKDLGMSRSELFSRAAAHYLDELDTKSLVCQIDEAVLTLAGADDGTADDGTADAVEVGHRVLAGTSDDW